MRRFRLVKDLPTFKAGTLAELDENDNLVLAEVKEENAPFIKGHTIYSFAELLARSNILTDWFEEISEQPKTVWELKEGDKYFDIDCLGVIEQQTWSGSFFDKQSLGMGNIFLACGGAAKELTRRRAKQILLRDTKGFKPNIYNLNQKRYYVSYDPVAKELWCGHESWDNFSHEILFATEEDAQTSIKAHEKEWKIYLGAEDE